MESTEQFKLHDYQQIGVAKLADSPRFLLLDDPGMGKTVQVIRAADKVKAKRVRVVCPAGIVPQWKRQIARLSETGFDADVMSYEKARAVMSKDGVDCLFIDEGHYLKNRKAQRTKALFGAKTDGKGGMIDKVPYVWHMTGSPAPNHPGELWSQIHAIAPQAITMKSGRVMDYWSFIDRFCIVKNNGFGQVITGGKNLELLKERLQPFMLRRKKSDYRLPPTIDTLVLEPGDALKAMREAENSPEGKAIADALAKHGVDGLSMMTPHSSSLRRITGLAKVAPVIRQLEDEFDGGLEKIVLIAYHRDVIEGLQKGLTELGIGCAVYYGGMTERQKETAKETFIKNAACRVFIGQITAAGTGTDGLQEVTGDMLLVEYSWVPEENKQIISRLDRMGQANDVLARFVSLAGSLDEKIAASVRRKTADILTLFG